MERDLGLEQADKAVELGATVLMPADDSSFGRMGILQGPQGEAFGVIDPTTTAG